MFVRQKAKTYLFWLTEMHIASAFFRVLVNCSSRLHNVLPCFTIINEKKPTLTERCGNKSENLSYKHLTWTERLGYLSLLSNCSFNYPYAFKWKISFSLPGPFYHELHYTAECMVSCTKYLWMGFGRIEGKESFDKIGCKAPRWPLCPVCYTFRASLVSATLVGRL